MFRICEGLALLDMLASFAHSVTSMGYVRPVFSDTLALKSARHPVLGKVRPRQSPASAIGDEMTILTRSSRQRRSSFVPNDYYGTDNHRLQVVTGYNMSGKSTYIRAVALLQVMAQIGCFVPAEYASFIVIRSLFSRLSTDDRIEANLSTFSVEMREVAFILRYGCFSLSKETCAPR
ncbi:hypothetical protein VTK73DRAFT_4870 [Phialemonium thermophilum]|uniref:DNA mismatch repair proteins mutS family domain-containing protein n=1 Tax=Phialemonium thermophilum TaxID=223376 RepID=A0ABR3V5A6_9PEZI